MWSITYLINRITHEKNGLAKFFTHLLNTGKIKINKLCSLGVSSHWFLCLCSYLTAGKPGWEGSFLLSTTALSLVWHSFDGTKAKQGFGLQQSMQAEQCSLFGICGACFGAVPHERLNCQAVLLCLVFFLLLVSSLSQAALQRRWNWAGLADAAQVLQPICCKCHGREDPQSVATRALGDLSTLKIF